MSLRTKILGGYGLVLVLLILLGGYALVNLRLLGSTSDTILEENYRSIRAAENMTAALERQDSFLLSFLLSGDAEGLANFRRSEITFSQSLGRAQDNVTLPQEPEILNEIEMSYLAYLETVSALQAETFTEETAVDYYYNTILPAFQQVRAATIELRDLNQDAMVAASNETHDVATGAIISTAVAGVVAAGLGLALSYLLSQRLTHPLHEMMAVTERIASGDYDVALQPQSEDELGQLAEKINDMSRRLKAFHDLNVEQVIAEKQRSDAIIRSITDGIIVVNAGFQIVAINPRAAHIFKTSVDAANGRHLYDVTQNDTMYDTIRHCTDSGETLGLYDDETSIEVEQNGATRHYNYAATPVITAEGQRLGVVLIFQDITKLKELDRLKSEFVMTASHELRTPLTGMEMSISLLMEDEAIGGRQRELLETAHEEVQRLQTLINDLLDLSKIEAGRIDLDFQPVPVYDLVQNALQPFVVQAEEQGVTLRNEVTPDVGHVSADANKITWVLTNLIGNALRFTGEGGHVTVSAHARQDDVYIAVADDGEGIPPEYQSKIFDKFVQVNGRRSGGTGLGLAISKEFVRSHGGTIWVKSEPGVGSTFTFTLPRTQMELPE